MIRKTGELIDLNFENLGIQLACHFTNFNGQGELETVLRVIKNQPSVYADCLQKWKECLESHGQTITTKDFDKFWVSNYLRFDTCLDNEKRQAGRKCSMAGFEYVMREKTHIWNFDHDALNSLNEFFYLFC